MPPLSAEDGGPVDAGQVIFRVSSALARLIRSHIGELAADSAVVFDSPADIDSYDDNRLSLFLYRIDQNPWLRNLPPTLTRRPAGDGRPAALTSVAAPLVVDLIYMMVPYGKSSELELVLGDKLVRLFHDIAALDGPWSDPLLRATGNASIDIVPEAESFHVLRDVWAGFPGKSYRLTKLYRLSPVRLPSGISTTADMVERADGDFAPPPADHGPVGGELPP